MTVPGRDRAGEDRLHRRVLAVEDPGCALEPVDVGPRDLHDGARGGAGPVQHDDATGVDRRVEGVARPRRPAREAADGRGSPPRSRRSP